MSTTALPAIDRVSDDSLERMVARAWREAARCAADLAAAGDSSPIRQLLGASLDGAVEYHQLLRDEWQRRAR